MKKIITTLLVFILFLSSYSLANQIENPKLKGSFRYRNEIQEGTSTILRNRHRIQFKLGFHTQVNNRSEIGDAKIGFTLASGNSNTTSTNQTLKGGFSSKEIYIDQAYANWNPFQVSGLFLLAGKYKIPFRNQGSSLIYDSDLNTEGLTFGYKNILSSSTKFYVQTAWFSLTENKANNVDLQIIAGQVGVKFAKVLTFGVGYTTFPRLQGQSPFVEGNKSFGNSLDTNNNFNTSYSVVDAYVTVNVATSLFHVKIIGNFVTNTAADSNNIGFLAGVKVGNVNKKKVWSWEVSGHYQVLESDAVFAAFTDSDFNGGGTDNKGFKFQAAVTGAKNVVFSNTLFIAESNSSTSNHVTNQLDAKFHF